MTTREIRFVADGMLQSLGAWLRLLGYDCTYRQGAPSRVMFEQAVAEDRVFLTRNAHLRDTLPAALLNRGEVFYVAPEHLPGQLRAVVNEFDLETESKAFTRCVVCNVPLDVTATPPAGTPKDVADREREFWQCPSCRQAFWRGSHVHNSLARLRHWLKESPAAQ
jgi:uncharacterized protein with PIN domain